jgi:hypothetical protein
MLVEDPAAAQVELFLASNDDEQLDLLLRDLKSSKYIYSFVHFAFRGRLVESALERILRNAGRAPIVLVIDYKFAKGECEALLLAVRKLSKITTIQCLVTNPPQDDPARSVLIGLGARLYDEDSAGIASLLTLH